MFSPNTLVGVIIGASVVFMFSGLAINAVTRAAGAIVFEVRRQFRENPGIMEGTVRPEYGRVVDICTRDSLRELATPGLLAIFAPIAVGFGLGVGPLAGYLAGAIATGTLMAIFLANSGGAWDNGKKLVEDGNHGGKGSDAHAATVIGDTVGDPFKDTAGPAINPLIKVMNLVSLLIAPAVVALSLPDAPGGPGPLRDRDRRGRRHRGGGRRHQAALDVDHRHPGGEHGRLTAAPRTGEGRSSTRDGRPSPFCGPFPRPRGRPCRLSPMRRSRILLFAAVTAAAVALSGCSATVTGSPAPTGASTNGRRRRGRPPTRWQWTDKVCGSLLRLQRVARHEAAVRPERPVCAAVKALSDFLGKSEASIDQAISGLDAAGPAPVANGDAAVAKIKSALTTIRSSFDQAKTALDKIDPNNVDGAGHRAAAGRRAAAGAVQAAGPDDRPAVEPRARGRRSQGAQLPDAEEEQLTACRSAAHSNTCSRVRGVSQLSLFSADARPAALTDLAGLLCGPGQIVRFGAGDQARLSIVLADAARAPAVRAAPRRGRGRRAGRRHRERGHRAAHRVPLRPGRSGPGVDPRRGQGGAVGMAAGRSGVTAVGAHGGRAGRPWRLPAGARPARPADPPGARRGHHPRRVAPGPASAGALRISGTRRVARLVELVGPATRPDARRHVAAIPRPHGVLNRAP